MRPSYETELLSDPPGFLGFQLMPSNKNPPEGGLLHIFVLRHSKMSGLFFLFPEEKGREISSPKPVAFP
jgi:hypothetical protein